MGSGHTSIPTPDAERGGSSDLGDLRKLCGSGHYTSQQQHPHGELFPRPHASPHPPPPPHTHSGLRCASSSAGGKGTGKSTSTR